MNQSFADNPTVSRRALLCFGGLVVPSFWSADALAIDAVGRMTEVRGSVSAQGFDGFRTLDKTSQIFLQDLVRTSAAARATLQMGSRTTVRLGENVRFRIDQYTIDRGGTLELGAGAAFIDTNGSQPMGLVIRSPSALIAVRGTAFFVGTEHDGRFGVFVRSGAVEVTAASQSIRLNRGQGTSISSPGLPPERAAVWTTERINRALALTR